MRTKFTWMHYVLAACVLLSVFFMLSNILPSGGGPSVTEMCNQEKGMHFKGRVKELLLDSFNLSRKFIVLSNGEKIMPPFTTGLWIEADIGDSIVKDTGTLNYKIYKNADPNALHTLIWDRPCPN